MSDSDADEDLAYPMVHGVSNVDFVKLSLLYSLIKITVKDLLYLGNLRLIKANIFQINQMIRMINLKVNENKSHKIPLSNFFLSQIVKDVIKLEMR